MQLSSEHQGSTVCEVDYSDTALVLNAIDAGATSIAVRADLRYFKFQVVDNGHGMDLENIDRVGSRYMTSKCHTLQDLYSHLDFFGFRGEALASLRELSGILALESRPSGNEHTYCKIFTHGKSHRAGLANTKRPSVGTTVTVTDFMYNMPVRRKRIKEAVDLEEIKSQLECIALMHPQVSISLRNDVKYNIIMQTHRTTDTLKVFSNLFGDNISNSLVPVLFELDRFKVSGYIGKNSHPQKNLQFIYVNKRLVLKSKLHKLVNALLAKSFILRANGPWRNVPISKKLDSHFFIASSPPEKRNKYGVYVLNVECSYCDYDIALDPRKTLIEFKDWDSILKCTEEAVRSFLERESLVFSGDLDSDYRSSPSKDVGKLCDESFICEMDQLSKECALALSNHTSKLIDNNTFVDPHKTVGVEALNGAGMVHGLPARRKASVKEKILASSLPQSPNMFNTGLNIDNQASKLNVFESTLVTEIEKCSENPIPSSTFSESILSSKGLKRKCDKSDKKSKKHFVKPAIPQKKHKCNMNKINSVSTRASSFSLSAGSEDPLFSCKHYLTKSKPKDDLISLPKLTKENTITDKTLSADSHDISTTNDPYNADNEITISVNALEPMPELQVACLIDLEHCKGSEDSSNINQWTKTIDSEGSVFYVHKRSGITSFDAPVPTQDQVSFSMINRCSFLPKGMSPIMKTSSCKPINNDASLMPTSCQIMKDVISKSNSLQDELAVIKWRDLLEVQDSGSKPYVTQLLDDAENRMKYCEQPVPNAKIIDKCAINIYNVMFPYAFTREMFSSVKVLGQMDKKFIVTLASVAGSKKPHVIVLFDQHAVHERIRLEKLMKDYQIDGCNTHFRSTEIIPPLSLSLSSKDVRILSSFEEEFGRLGLYYQLTNETQIYVTKIPTCLKARESREDTDGKKEEERGNMDTRETSKEVPETSKDIYRNNYVGPVGRSVLCSPSKRPPYEKYDKYKKYGEVENQGFLVTCYAWDGNSWPGNEFWDGHYGSTGYSASAASKYIAQLHNPVFNVRLQGNYRIIGAEDQINNKLKETQTEEKGGLKTEIAETVSEMVSIQNKEPVLVR
uniref:Uncharacterized protein n=1 Tax=Timema poppense TaxID=170557 RepID=A0A7R9CXU2_TIMPO|nr:unnamed protein product [Timema poppensis]